MASPTTLHTGRPCHTMHTPGPRASLVQPPPPPRATCPSLPVPSRALSAKNRSKGQRVGVSARQHRAERKRPRPCA